MKKTTSVVIAVLMILSVLFSMPISSSAATKDSSAGLVNTTSSALNVRSGQSTSSTVLASLSKGSYVTLISRSGSWWYVEYASGKYGYCSANYINNVGTSYPAYVNLTSGNLNVRTGASTSYSIKTRLANGKTVIVLSQANGWSRILYNGVQTGYVSSVYLKTYSLSNTQTYPSVKLSVVSFKQTDSRWNNYPIGTNGGTIGTIGCATTAIAMIESHRTGTTITPPTMASRLSYSAGGSVYWPSTLKFTLTNSYSAIYNALKSGKPVLYGVKNSSGSQHWVIITGYSGGSSLTASGFIINDPGSNSRTNLQQLLNSYPTFYKYATY